jgi:hypothetical protein
MNEVISNNIFEISVKESENIFQRTKFIRIFEDKIHPNNLKKNFRQLN